MRPNLMVFAWLCCASVAWSACKTKVNPAQPSAESTDTAAQPQEHPAAPEHATNDADADAEHAPPADPTDPAEENTHGATAQEDPAHPTQDDEATPPDESAENEPYSWARENIGPLSLRLTDTDVRALLGEPERKSEVEESPASGDNYADWDYPAQGVHLVMSHETLSPSSPATISKIFVTAPCTWKTSQDVGIGSSFRVVRRAYRKIKDRDQEDHYVDPRGFIRIGSPYGGVTFSFEDERVSEIFIGAGAE